MKNLFTKYLSFLMLFVLCFMITGCKKNSGKIELRIGFWPENTETKDIAMYQAWKEAFEADYPELKADKNFAQLNSAVMDIEENLQAARRVYNSNVRALNEAIVVFPSSFVANKKGITKRDFFEAEEQKRQDVKMDFS